VALNFDVCRFDPTSYEQAMSEAASGSACRYQVAGVVWLGEAVERQTIQEVLSSVAETAGAPPVMGEFGWR